MRIAKETSWEIMEDSQPHQQDYERIKSDINDLLVSHLPSNITLDNFEVLAIVVMDIISNPTKYLTHKSNSIK